MPQVRITSKNNRLFSFGIIILIVLISIYFGFFLSKNLAVQTALSACDSSGGRVKEEAFTIHEDVEIYSNVLPISFIESRGDKYISMFPVWVVKVNAPWMVSGGPLPEFPNDSPPAPFVMVADCTVFINAITNNVLVVNFPMIE